MSYGFTVYTDRPAIAKIQVYSETSGKTYEYAYGTGQHSLSGFTDGDSLTITAVPADGYNFTQWVYHIGSPTAPTQYSKSNPFKYYGSEGNDIYIAAEGSIGEPTGIPTITSLTCHTTPGSLDITVKIVGTNIIGYALDFYLVHIDSSDTTFLRTITSNSFSTTITATYYSAQYLRVRFNPNGAYAQTYEFRFTLEDYFQWSSDVRSGGIVKNVSHTEWDNFIDKIKEVLTNKGIQNQPITESKYGYDIGTTYNTMLNDCYLQYNSDLQGYPLTAKKFNIARFIIGSNVSTDIGDKISNSSKVLASDFIKLAECLKTWQG